MTARSLLILLAAFALTVHAQEPAPITAAQAWDRIQKALAIPAPAHTVDTLKAGDPSTPITGIATTFIPTMDVLRRAADAGENLVIVHEPTFYNHPDDIAGLEQDPVYGEKLQFIRDHHLVLYRLHDVWHMRIPDPMVEALAQRMDWIQFRQPAGQYFFKIPPTTLAVLAQSLQSTLGARIIRVIGDPRLPVSQIALAPGAAGREKQIRALERDDVEVLIAGEASEWETVEYARDASLQGRHKALILLGHETSEELGMKLCADWLKTVFPEEKISFLPAGEPYWLPSAPAAAGR